MQRVGVEDPEIVSGVAFFVAFMTISYLHIVVGELAPKSMAIRMSEPVALWTAAPLFAFYWVMYPFIRGLNASAFWILRKLNLDVRAHVEGGYSVDEIKLILRSHVDASIANDDWRVLAQALDFGDAEVADLMRPFYEAVVLARDRPLAENLATVASHRFSRYPYVDESGALLGVIHLKDLFLAIPNGVSLAEFEAASRPPFLVAPDMSAAMLFRRFRTEGQHMAIVGRPGRRPLGLVTFDDLLSALVGGIRDEFRASKTDWTRIDDDTIVARGSLPLFTLEQLLGIDIQAEGVRTVGGLVLQQLESLPRPGQCVEFDHFTVTVERMVGARMTAVRIRGKHPADRRGAD